MKIIKFDKSKAIKPLFGLRLPDFVYELYLISITKDAFEKTIRNFMHIDSKRLIKLAEAVEGGSKSVLILIIYDTLVDGESKMLKQKLNTQVKDFDFPIFDLKIDETIFLENEIKIFKERIKI